MKADFEETWSVIDHDEEQRDDPVCSQWRKRGPARIDPLWPTNCQRDILPVSAKTQAELDPTARFKIRIWSVCVTCNDGKKDNGLIVNTVTPVSDNPNRIAVNVNKANYSCEVIDSSELNVSVLSEDATFKIFEHFGFQSGKNVDKFAGYGARRKRSTDCRI